LKIDEFPIEIIKASSIYVTERKQIRTTQTWIRPIQNK